MGRHSKISWAPATFNPWIGCEKVSPACDHCYAESLAKRTGLAEWGRDVPRRRTSASYWRGPLKWEADATRTGERLKVFCASLADVFEGREDLDPWRRDLWELIEQTPHLDWMLLTKRPENIVRMLPARWIVGEKPERPNVWLGTTAENQRRADERIPHLFAAPAVVYWVSAEPLLGPIDFSRHFSYEVETGQTTGAGVHGIDWIIVGGESGTGARRMDPAWARDILRQCREHGAAYHFKQKGEVLSRELGCKDKAGKDSAEWPENLRVQEFPRAVVA
jgi:protein gp37